VRLRGTVEEPGGLVYEDEFISEEEERELLGFVRSLELHPVVMHDQPSRRLVRHFGYGYDYDSWRVREVEPIPEELEDLRRETERFASAPEGAFVEALVSYYPPGAGINWHRDAGAFAGQVVGVSLGAACLLQLRRGSGEQRRVYELVLAPRSVYLLSGAARSLWQHHVPPVKTERYSLTFRALRQS
jgi:alkylated DNA repair dioxygenase AlkB